MKGTRRGRWLALSLLAACAGGCRVDRWYPEDAAPKGPIETFRQSPSGELSYEASRTMTEVDLVEEVVTARQGYERTLQKLRDYYATRGQERKQTWAERELTDLADVQKFVYILDAEIPDGNRRPMERVAAADELYWQAMTLMKKGGSRVPVFYREKLMLEALQHFKQLIRLHPASDKLDDAAFYCGEIHKEYLKDQEDIAVRWYERAIQWNPQTPHPARFQAAVVYDYRLHDRAKALELYHDVIKYERDLDVTNARFASRRIDELTQGHLTGEPPRDYRRLSPAPRYPLEGPPGP